MRIFRRTRWSEFRGRGASPLRLEALEVRHLLTGFPLGGETLVSPFEQAALYPQSVTEFTDQAVAVHDDGSFAVAYTSHGEDGLGDEVYIRRFGADRKPLPDNDLLRVSTDGAGDQNNAAITTLPGGGLLVAWYDRGCSLGLDDACSAPFDGEDAIFARRFDASGEAVDAEPWRVNVDLSGAETSPAVAASPDGGYSISWAGRDAADQLGGVWLRRFDATGQPLDGPEARLFSGGAFTESPTLDVDNDGNLAIAWSVVDRISLDQGSEVLGQYFSADGGAPVDLSFDDGSTNERKWPSLDMDASGNFVVAYTQAESSHQIDASHDIFVRRFSVGGAPIDEVLTPVNTTVEGDQRLGRVAAAGDGSFLVAWTSSEAQEDETHYVGILAREFDSTGAPFGDEFSINSTDAGAQTFASVEMSPEGVAVVVWSGFGDQVDATPESGDQSDSAGVFFQGIQLLAPVGDIDVLGSGGSILDGETETSLEAGTRLGEALAGEGRTNREFVIRNAGFGRLRFAGDPSVTVEGGEEGEFTVADLDVDYLDPGDSVAFVLSFAPAAVGMRSATVTVHTDDTDEGPFQFAVVGVGLAPTHPWRNPDNPYDVNGDGIVSGLDALIIINRLNKHGPHSLPPPDEGQKPPPYYDVNGDNKLTALDALQTINVLNKQRQSLAIQSQPPPAAASSIAAVSSAERQRRQSLASNSARRTTASTDAVFGSWSDTSLDQELTRKTVRRRAQLA
ncbi:MAG: dockerin type I domain-containing protein [Planctomycetia bacterium]|nr:dockerin type I domain-containing protein [Planctomycetia bacterium]